jgi:hypothetical protein
MAFNWDQLVAADRTAIVNGFIKDQETRYRKLQCMKQSAQNRPLTGTYTAEVQTLQVATIQTQMDQLEGEHTGVIAWRDGGGTPPTP